MARKEKAILGDYNMTSDRNGRVYKRSEMRKEWTGNWVHKSEWEPKHPQLVIIPRVEKIAEQPARSEDDPLFIPFTPVAMPGDDLDEY